MNYIGSFGSLTTSITSRLLGSDDADAKTETTTPTSPRTPPPPSSPTPSDQDDYETTVDCTSISQCLTAVAPSFAYYTTPDPSSLTPKLTSRLISHEMDGASDSNLLPSNHNRQSQGVMGMDPQQTHSDVMNHIEQRAHVTHHPHHNSVIGLHYRESGLPHGPSNSHRSVPRGFLIQLRREDEPESEDFLSPLSPEEQEAYARFTLKCDEMSTSSPNFIRPTRWELREMAVGIGRYESDVILSRYLNACNWICDEATYGAVPYWHVMAELDKGYYSLAGDDLHGCPIIILEQTKVDGNVDYMIRTKTAVTLALAVVSMDLKYARNGISMFADLRNIGWGNINLKFQRYIYTLLRSILYYTPGFMALYETPTIVRWAFKLSKPFLSDTYRDMGTRVLEKNDDANGQFDWFANADQLPPKYGGSFEQTEERNLRKIVRNYLINCGVTEEELVPPR